MFYKKKKILNPTECHFEEAPDRITNGELPFGWETHNSEFIARLESEVDFYKDRLEHARRSKDPTTRREALKSTLAYIESVQELCDRKGECFSFWCSEYLIGRKWELKLERELNYLEEKDF